ncbi:hypothetical protein ASPVEDRAFT_45113 [Aspergillus versicolor CBS 583.65]|uniref:Uncharacterized protein n=1 Tax=Aspergillus versicolor CBS 583.65 TaxID=1036611 RepID=A0A1L9PVN8_ASPVE|nr:uncharacterized protein ASPVEDRAFT_45113 [Aspergillus versicolor CBS 583.65]OJJ05610.1 hypothetical protein ASPVEDRAFT_45113 [Aspergillus versicolor CBS 583.65]
MGISRRENPQLLPRLLPLPLLLPTFPVPPRLNKPPYTPMARIPNNSTHKLPPRPRLNGMNKLIKQPTTLCLQHTNPNRLNPPPPTPPNPTTVHLIIHPRLPHPTPVLVHSHTCVNSPTTPGLLSMHKDHVVDAPCEPAALLGIIPGGA